MVSGWRSLFAAMSPRMRRLVRWSLALMAGQLLAVVARVVEFVLSAPVSVWVPTSVLMFGLGGPCIGLSLRMRAVRLAEDAEAQAERVRRAEFLRLRAPDPLPGQCPVCAYDDLGVLGERDRDLGVEGTELARVVAYGPHRAHSECAAVVPYVPPPRSTSGGMTLGHAVLALDGRPHLCRCPQCERARPRSTRGGYAAGDVPVSQMGPLPEVLTRPALKPPLVNGTLRDSIKVTGTYWARCGRCPWIGSAGTQDATEGLLRVHAQTCRKRKR